MDSPLLTSKSRLFEPNSKNTDVKKEETQMVRASMDMGIPNKSMRSTTKSGTYVIYRLHDCKIFTKLDLRQGYHQLALDPLLDRGNYRPQRLVFGPKSSQNVFDQAMSRISGDIAHFLNQRDDILFRGREDAEKRRCRTQTCIWIQ